PLENEDIYPEPNMFLAASQRNGRGPNGDFVPEAPTPATAGRGAATTPAPGRGAPGAATPPPRRWMPSQGFYVRHVKGIQFDNIVIQGIKEDLRPAFVLDDVEGADFFEIKTPHAADTPVFALHNVTDFTVRMCAGVKDTQLQRAEQTTM
ncbi:MAG TPA: hypothetical protein VN754_00565, partial [Candidatus Binataceae bacterium]|nr:hypothetical protein [Candidatus Binataceae bacterium]